MLCWIHLEVIACALHCRLAEFLLCGLGDPLTTNNCEKKFLRISMCNSEGICETKVLVKEGFSGIARDEEKHNFCKNQY